MTAAVLYRQASARVLIAAFRLRIALKLNPDWHLQPRVPAGHPHGGRWVASNSTSALPPALVTLLAREVLRSVARRIRPYLNLLPDPWTGELPIDGDFDEETRRIGPPTLRRPQHESLRFRSFRELRSYLGNAAPGYQWHHIVEQNLAGTRFSVEMIHSTDNIIELRTDLHFKVNAAMSSKRPYTEGLTIRQWLRPKSFEFQYDYGRALLEELTGADDE